MKIFYKYNLKVVGIKNKNCRNNCCVPFEKDSWSPVAAAQSVDSFNFLAPSSNYKVNIFITSEATNYRWITTDTVLPSIPDVGAQRSEHWTGANTTWTNIMAANLNYHKINCNKLVFGLSPTAWQLVMNCTTDNLDLRDVAHIQNCFVVLVRQCWFLLKICWYFPTFSFNQLYAHCNSCCLLSVSHHKILNY